MELTAPRQGSKNSLRNSTAKEIVLDKHKKFSKERILRKTETLEIIERPIGQHGAPVGTQKTFTTKPLIRRKKTGHRLVRRTAQALVDYWYPETVVSYEAMDKALLTRFERCDKKTRLAYLGRPATRQVERVDHEVRYRKSGTVTYKDHTFTHRLPAKKGYLELFGLATLFVDKQGKAWFRLHHQRQTELIPPTTPLKSVSECVDGSKKISLPLNRLLSHTIEQPKVNMVISEGEKRECINGERKSEISESILSPEELRILRASMRLEGG